MQRVSACPVCGGGDLAPFAMHTRASALHFAQVRCRGCGLVLSQPQASDEELERYYTRTYYEELWPAPEQMWGEQYRCDEAPLMRRLWRDWPPVAGGRAVEIGCGYGHMLSLLAEDGYRVSGCEMGERAVAHCRALGLDVVPGRVPGAPFADGQFDLSLALQVIEHVRDPRSFVVEMVRLVKPGGVVVVATENIWIAQYAWDRLRAHATGRVAPFRSAEDHTFVFSAKHLERLLRDAGCDDVRTASYSRTPPRESLHWKLYKGLFRTVDRWLDSGAFLMAVGRRRP